MSSYAKIRVKGSDAMDFLQLICANDVDVKPGKMVYTQWLNDKGGIEADLTVTCVEKNKFRIVTGSGVRVHDKKHILKHLNKSIKFDIKYSVSV